MGTSVGSTAILEAAQRLLRDRGPDKISGMDIAREASVDPALLRYYFGSKDKLIVAAIRRLLEDLATARNAATAEGSPRERLHARVLGLIELLRHNPNLHEVMLHRVVRRDGPDLSEVSDLRERLILDAFHDVEAIAREAARCEGVEPSVDPRFLYVAYIALCEFSTSGFPLLELLSGEPLDPRETLAQFAEFATDILMRAILRPPCGG